MLLKKRKLNLLLSQVLYKNIISYQFILILHDVNNFFKIRFVTFELIFFYSNQVLRRVEIQVVRFVVGLANVGQSGGVLLQQTVDGVNPEPAAVVILLVVPADEPGVLVYEVGVFQQRQQLLNVVDDGLLVVISGNGKLGEPDLLPVPLAVVLQYLK